MTPHFLKGLPMALLFLKGHPTHHSLSDPLTLHPLKALPTTRHSLKGRPLPVQNTTLLDKELIRKLSTSTNISTTFIKKRCLKHNDTFTCASVKIGPEFREVYNMAKLVRVYLLMETCAGMDSVCDLKPLHDQKILKNCISDNVIKLMEVGEGYQCTEKKISTDGAGFHIVQVQDCCSIIRKKSCTDRT